MQQQTATSIDAWWAGLLGLDEVWHTVTVRPHTGLGDYPGWYVAWRGAGVHVSVPSTASTDEIARLVREPPSTLATEDFWAGFGEQRGLELRGPAVHAYLDVDPGPAPGVVDVRPEELRAMRAEVTSDDWEAWWTDDPQHPVAVVEDGRLVAAAALGGWNGVGRDIGVLVVPDRRGRGLAALVGRTCASYAVRDHGFALWRAALTNVASVRTASRIGFEPWVTQLALRPTDPPTVPSGSSRASSVAGRSRRR